jgi:hypothetical protein
LKPFSTILNLFSAYFQIFRRHPDVSSITWMWSPLPRAAYAAVPAAFLLTGAWRSGRLTWRPRPGERLEMSKFLIFYAGSYWIMLDCWIILDLTTVEFELIHSDSQWFTTFWDNFTSMLQPPGAGLRLWMLMANLVVHKARAQAKSPSFHRSFARSKRILLIACRMLFTSSIQNTVIIMLHAQILELNSNTVSSNAKTWSILEHPVRSSISKSRARLLESINVPMPFGFVS